ncbi:MAG: hypothetical protein ACM3NT_02195 [Methylocystaceae bacterium]
MKYRPLLWLLILVLSINLLGCSKKTSDSPSPSSVAVETTNNQENGIRTITNSTELVSSYRDWTVRLDDIASKTKAAYTPWSKGEITVEKYLEQTKKLYEEMKQLNIETDLKTDVKLKKDDTNETEKAGKIIAAYQLVSKDLNDFLVTSNTRGDDEIKAKYQELILNNYTAHLKALNDLLKN